MKTEALLLATILFTPVIASESKDPVVRAQYQSRLEQQSPYAEANEAAEKVIERHHKDLWVKGVGDVGVAIGEGPGEVDIVGSVDSEDDVDRVQRELPPVIEGFSIRVARPDEAELY